MKPIKNIMTIAEMIKTLQELQLKPVGENQFYFYVEEVEEDKPTPLSKEQIADVLESREQAIQGGFVRREDMKAFFINAKKELQLKEEPKKFAKNKTANALLRRVEETGGIDSKTANFIRTSGIEFRENFEFKNDKI